MTIEELQLILNTTGWIYLGSGAYNRVYRSKKELTIDGYTGLWVLKTQPDFKDFNEKSRAVRKWKAINPKHPAFITRDGWIVPYMGNKPASDEQIALKVIDIYRQTRNIIVDAAGKNNFLEYQGEVVCIDVDQALKKGSFISNMYDTESPQFADYLVTIAQCGFPKTMTVIQTLLYLQWKLPESLITNQMITPRMIAKLAVFIRAKRGITEQDLHLLLTIDALDPEGEIKNKYITPQLVSHLHTIQSEKQSISLALIRELIHDAITTQGDITMIIKNGDVDDLRILIQQNKALLYHVDQQGYTLLHHAALAGCSEIVRYLLDEGLSHRTLIASEPNHPNYQKNALALALTNTNDAVIELLLNVEDNFDIRNYALYRDSLFFFAARVGNLNLIQLLLANYPELLHVADVRNQTGLLWAAANGQQEVLEFFISAGASLNQPTKLLSINARTSDLNNSTPLDWAIRNGHRTIFLTLWNAGAKANHQHRKIQNKNLEWLIDTGALDHVQTLITHNPVLLNQKDQHGLAPLHYAVLHGQKDIAQWLIAEGADINLVTEASPLLCEQMRCINTQAWSMAIRLGAFEIAKLILTSVADGPFYGNKAQGLLFAAEHGLIALVQRLVAEGALLVHVQDNCNQTPLLLAARNGHHAIVKLLIDQGANVNRPTRLPGFGYYPEQEENNYTPLDWAIKGEHTETINVLKNAGAIQNQAATSCEKNTISNHLALSLFNPAASSSNSSVLDVEVEEHSASDNYYRLIYDN